jgi:hypothetical protein
VPLILSVGPYRFYFYSWDRNEPAHVHVRRDRCVAKIWLDPVVLDRVGGFPEHEARRLVSLVLKHRQELLEAWNEFPKD